MRVFFDPAYVGSAYAFDTTRKAQWVADSLIQSPIPGVELAAPRPLTWDQVARVHDDAYVAAIRTGQPRALAESQGFAWDPRLGEMVLSSNGGAVAASLDALEHGVAGSLSSGLHHARRDRGAGFCTFNGLVLAARHALDAGAGSVLILDFDAHCGGGTASLIDGDRHIREVDVSVSNVDRYPGGDEAQLRIVADDEDYLSAIEQALHDVEVKGDRFGLCLYNAGMDPYEGCAIGGREGITEPTLAARETMVFRWCRERSLPVAFVLAGGYIGSRLSQQGLVRLHRLTVSAAAAISHSEGETMARLASGTSTAGDWSDQPFICAIASRPRRSSSSGVRSSLWVAISHWWPKGSASIP